MKSLFILQLVCCVITAMLALQLAMASLQVRWKVWRYEISRWILVASMLFFSVHYLLQMIHGLRAQGTDVGAAFNILFYTPVAFAITLSIINIESTGNKVRRYCLRGMMAYILIAIVFVIGMFKSQSLHIGNMLYVMLGLFVASMAYFILIIRKETKARKQKLMENFGIDLIPYVRYSQASIILLYFAAGLLPVAILFNTLLYIIGPLILLSVIFFVHTFIAMGYYITPKEVIPEENDAEAKVTEAEDMKDGKNTHGTNILTANRKMEIELALKNGVKVGNENRSEFFQSNVADTVAGLDELLQMFIDRAILVVGGWASQACIDLFEKIFIMLGKDFQQGFVPHFQAQEGVLHFLSSDIVIPLGYLLVFGIDTDTYLV